MRLRFHFSMKRLLVSVSLLCLSLGLVSWGVAGIFPVPLLALYFATIVLGVAAANLVARPLLGAIVVMLCWTLVMAVRAASGVSPSVLLTIAVVLVAFLAGMATQRYLDRRRSGPPGKATLREEPVK